jgi:hypothetical protein
VAGLGAKFFDMLDDENEDENGDQEDEVFDIGKC